MGGYFELLDNGTAKLVRYKDNSYAEIPTYVFDDYGTEYTVTEISSEAFSGCSSLKTIEIPQSVETIGSYAFSGCSSLKTIEIPRSVVYIWICAFSGCSSLESIEIPQSVIAIGSYAFYGCSSLKAIELPDQLTKIEYGTFSGCSSLEAIEIPRSVESIGYNAFYRCSSLKAIELPEQLTKIEYDTFCGCSSLEAIEIPRSVESIGGNAFYGCSSLDAIDIPRSVKSIGSNAFYGCSALKTIELPDQLTKIEGYTFSGCSSLEAIEIPQSVVTIGSNAFAKCFSITKINLHPITPPTCSSDAFESTIYSTAILIVPGQSIKSYKSNSVWSKFNNMINTVSSLDDEDWELLKKLKVELQAMGWKGDWNTEDDSSEERFFEGIRTLDSHVTEIDLSSAELKGELPATIFKFPLISKINLSDNQLEGSITEIIGKLIADNSELCSELTDLNLSNNLLSGNLSEVANRCGKINNLDISHNKIADLYPALTRTIPSLNYNDQDIDVTLDLRFPVLSSAFVENIPTIMLYDRSKKSYSEAPTDILAWFPDVVHVDGDEYEICKIPLSFSSENLSLNWNKVRKNLLYHGNNNVIMTMSGRENSKCCLRFNFNPGDINFDGYVNISDLQLAIYLLCDYCPNEFSNFTAADLTGDEEINVRDLVAMVNILMKDEHPEIENSQMRSPSLFGESVDSIGEEDAIIDCSPEGICFTSSRPIAAFDIIVENANDVDLSSMKNLGFICDTRKCTDDLHIIGYSLSGSTLSVGTTIIPAKFNSHKARVRYAALCDEEAVMMRTVIGRNVVSGVQSVLSTAADLQFNNGKIIITATPGERVEWTAYTPEGMKITEGNATPGSDGTSSFYLNYEGIVIISVKTDGGIISKKINYTK